MVSLTKYVEIAAKMGMKPEAMKKITLFIYKSRQAEFSEAEHGSPEHPMAPPDRLGTLHVGVPGHEQVNFPVKSNEGPLPKSRLHPIR